MYSLGRRYWHPTIGRFSTRVLLLPPEVCPILSGAKVLFKGCLGIQR